MFQIATAIAGHQGALFVVVGQKHVKLDDLCVFLSARQLHLLYHPLHIVHLLA